jgi:hypothetical protein
MNLYSAEKTEKGIYILYGVQIDTGPCAADRPRIEEGNHRPKLLRDKKDPTRKMNVSLPPPSTPQVSLLFLKNPFFPCLKILECVFQNLLPLKIIFEQGKFQKMLFEL